MSAAAKDYGNDVENQWCPGCGNFGILTAVKRALARLDLPPQSLVLASGIGQAPKLPHYVRANQFDGLHGREVAAAQAIKLAADDLTVIVHAGDGGAYGEGGNHFLHAIRRNVDMTLIVHDNRVYGLTKGQASPTTEEGTAFKIQPDGVASRPINPLALAISQSCSFVAQGYAGETDHLVDLIAQAVQWKGFAFLNVLQPCVTWDRRHTYAWYRERCAFLPSDYDPTDRAGALETARADGKTIPLGVLYREARPCYQETVLRGIPHPLRDRGVEPERALALFDEFR
jgi:2-oxoglutarate/2-oxoacid ferredoxin oxidoreductase subunit beta